jgi:hypothetical protein
MKRILITCTAVIAALFTQQANAQSGWNTTSPSGPLATNNNTTEVRIEANTKFLFNPTLPTSSLPNFSLNSHINFERTVGLNHYRHINGNNIDYGLCLWSDWGWQNGGGILLNGVNSSFKGSVSFVGSTQVIPGDDENAFEFTTCDATGVWNAYFMAMKKNGKVVIGENLLQAGNFPGNYKLYVEGGILTEKVKVASYLGADWSDFVFADNYELRPLDEVESFIKDNKHLPDIPSASEVEKNGFDLADMDAKLLQKIEELTLYVIDLKKENTQLKQDIASLKK